MKFQDNNLEELAMNLNPGGEGEGNTGTGGNTGNGGNSTGEGEK